MSDIVLTASVRQNLLSLQSTADLLATTQNRLATGKKVNSALDNPTNFFTAAGLDARASDINNLLDGIGNGVQVLQAANTGITSLQKLIDSAKSIANQALQTQVGYTKSVLTTPPNPGANGANLLGTVGTPTGGTVTAGAFTAIDVSGTASAPTTATIDAGALGTVDLSGVNTLTFTLNIDGADHAITLDNTITAVSTAAVTGAELATAINHRDRRRQHGGKLRRRSPDLHLADRRCGRLADDHGNGRHRRGRFRHRQYRHRQRHGRRHRRLAGFLGHGRWYASQRRAQRCNR